MKAREVKDLAIACEALSRIPGYDADNLRSRLTVIIDNLVKEMEEPVKPPPIKRYLSNEEIPF